VTDHAAPLLAHLRARPADARPDEELLRAYAATGDSDAFRCLVERHGPLVLGVCRRVLGRGGDPEDAFQATFLSLARRAAAVRRPEALAGWLYRGSRPGRRN
jgi:DNA-directed RNA polymerase specialized sigma24 family protein